MDIGHGGGVDFFLNQYFWPFIEKRKKKEKKNTCAINQVFLCFNNGITGRFKKNIGILLNG